MISWAHVEAYTTELVAAVKTLTSHCQNVQATISDVETENRIQPRILSQAPVEAHWARGTIMANLAKLQTLLVEPPDFLQELARQTQLLACINWLGEFQVLACIPLRGSVPFKDVAELVGVSEMQLCRIVRMTATAGFLHEHHPSHVAHSALSAPFVTKPSYLDAAMFLAEIAAPAALHMAAATQRFGGGSQKPHESAYNVALNISATFASTHEHQPKLQRQWPAYLRYAMGDVDTNVMDLLACFSWLSLGNAVVVEVGAQCCSTAIALAGLYPELNFIVQINKSQSPKSQLKRELPSSIWNIATTVPVTRVPSSAEKQGEIPRQLTSRIKVESRVPAASQSVEGAAIYVLHLPSPSPTTLSRTLHTKIVAELKAHVEVLRANTGSRLILIARLLPESDTVDSEVAATACLRDLSLLQLANDHELEMVEFMNMLNGVRDSTGRLVLVNKLCAWNNPTVGFEVRYQSYAITHEPWPPNTSNI